MSDGAAMRCVQEELEKLLRAASTREQRSEIWTAVFTAIREVSDDEDWAIFRKYLDEEIAKRNAH